MRMSMYLNTRGIRTLDLLLVTSHGLIKLFSWIVKLSILLSICLKKVLKLYFQGHVISHDGLN